MHAHLHMGICMPVQVPMEGVGQRHQICWNNRELWVPWCGYWEPNSCPLWEQYSVLTTEPSFQLLAFGFWVCSQLPRFQSIVFWLAPLVRGRSSKKWGLVDGLSGAILRSITEPQAPLYSFASWLQSVSFYSSIHLSCDLVCNYRFSFKATSQLTETEAARTSSQQPLSPYELESWVCCLNVRKVTKTMGIFSKKKKTQNGDIRSRVENGPKETTLLFPLYSYLRESGRLCMGCAPIPGSQILYSRYNLGSLGSFLEVGIQVSSL